MKTPKLWVTVDRRGFSSNNDLKKLLEYDVVGIRLNTGRCPYAWIYETIEKLDKLNYPLSQILLDIANTKPRLNLVDKNGIDLIMDSIFVISDRINEGINAVLQNQRFFDEIKVNDIVYFGDGEIEGVVKEISLNTIILQSLSIGKLGDGVAIGIKGKDFFKFCIDEKEISEVNTLLNRFPVSIILSFVENADNIVWAKKHFPRAASIIPKIETVAAVNNIENIMALSDTIFIGRGDLGLSLGIEKIGIVQKILISKAQKAGCKISLGTGTLDSLKWSEIPLRAEIIDITNSCLEGVDYIALTSETGGSFTPFKSIDFTKKILDYVKEIEKMDINL
ncbi:MAG: pyruvate kinase [Candidatus Azobacteroides sp.]|nr:pyruvate kinase [Candidatus Azobacteroides sp.]